MPYEVTHAKNAEDRSRNLASGTKAARRLQASVEVARGWKDSFLEPS